MSAAAVQIPATQRPVRLLIVDDSAEDARLMASAINRSQYSVVFDHVNSPDAFRDNLENSDYDVILWDHNLTTWIAEDALDILQESGKQIPFIVITGTVGEEAAAQYLNDDASDYIPRGRFDRLPAVIERALQGQSQRKENAHLPSAIWAAKTAWEHTFDAIPDSVMLLNHDHRVVRANRAAADLFGLRRSQLIGQPCFGLLHCTSQPAIDCPFQRMVATDRKQESVFFESTLRKTFRVMTTPLRTETGTCGAIHVMQDVTESRRLEEALIQAQKLEGVGRLASGVVHDFNNILGVLLGYSELLQQQLSENNQSAKYIQPIIGAIRQAEKITGQLLAFSRKQVMQANVFDLNTVVAGLTEMLHRLIGEDIELVFTPDANPGMVKADQFQIGQVLVNLVVNARDAMPRGGRIAIAIENVYLDAQHGLQVHEEIAPGWYVSVSVTDTGTGMDGDLIAHIFEPFFTTKSADKGTGLGLSIVYGIVKQSGGYISVRSETGCGSTFTLYLPRTTETPQPRNQRSDPAKALEKNCTGTILVVEDEPDLAMVVNTVLTSAGYTILQAANGNEALRISEAHEGHIDLVLTDVGLPGDMDGTQLASSLGQLRPNTKILFMSGHSDALLDQGEDGNHRLLLQKPFSVAELRCKVLEQLSAHGPEETCDGPPDRDSAHL